VKTRFERPKRLVLNFLRELHLRPPEARSPGVLVGGVVDALEAMADPFDAGDCPGQLRSGFPGRGDADGIGGGVDPLSPQRPATS
jgi:hypothetical protein